MTRLSKQSAKKASHKSPDQVLRQAVSPVVPGVERLEPRQLLSCSYDAATRTVTVTGHDDDPDVTVEVQTGDQRLHVLIGYYAVEDCDFDPATVDSIVINGGISGDTITIDASVPDGITASINGADGDDTIVCENGGQQTIHGGNGADSISAGAGNDRLYGDADGDTLRGGGGADSMYGGAGIDLVTYDERTVGVRIVLNTFNSGDPTLSENDYIYADIENFDGGSGADYITGSQLANVLNGNAGNDTLVGGLGADTIYGYDGADVIYGGVFNVFDDTDGNDSIYGGEGNDTIYGCSGNDTIYCEGGNDLAYGGSGNDSLHGEAGVDYLNGDNPDQSTGGGNDYLDGGSEADSLVGGYGSDTLDGGWGADYMLGGDGDDTFEYLEDDATDTVSGEGGSDTVINSWDDDNRPAYDILTSIESFI